MKVPIRDAAGCPDKRLAEMIADFGAMLRIADRVARVKQMKFGESLLYRA